MPLVSLEAPVRHAAFGLFAPDDPHWSNWQLTGTDILALAR